MCFLFYCLQQAEWALPDGFTGSYLHAATQLHVNTTSRRGDNFLELHSLTGYEADRPSACHALPLVGVAARLHVCLGVLRRT